MNCGSGLAFDADDQTCKFLADVPRCSGKNLSNSIQPVIDNSLQSSFKRLKTPQSISQFPKQSEVLSGPPAQTAVQPSTRLSTNDLVSPAIQQNSQTSSKVVVAEQQSVRRERPLIRKVVIARRLPNGEFAILQPQPQLLQSLVQPSASRKRPSSPQTSQTFSAVEPTSDLNDDQEADVPPPPAPSPIALQPVNQAAGQQANDFLAKRQPIQSTILFTSDTVNLNAQANRLKTESNKVIRQQDIQTSLVKQIPTKPSTSASIQTPKATEKTLYQRLATQSPALKPEVPQLNKAPPTNSFANTPTSQSAKQQSIAYNHPTYPAMRPYLQLSSQAPQIQSLPSQSLKPILNSDTRTPSALSRSIETPLQPSPRTVQPQIVAPKKIVQQSRAPISFSHELTINHVVEVPDVHSRREPSIRQESPVVTLEQPLYSVIPETVNIPVRPELTYAIEPSAQGIPPEDNSDNYEDIE